MTDEEIKKRMESRKNDPIMPVMRKMQLEDTHSWPKSRKNTLYATKNVVELETGMKFITKTSADKIYVIRVK